MKFLAGFFDPIFDLSNPDVFLLILALLAAIGFGVGFAILYVIFKRDDGYYKDTPITYSLFPLIVAGLSIVVSVITNAFAANITSATSVEARIARAAVALVSALVIIKFRSEQRTPEDLTYIFFLTGIGMLCGIGFLGFAVILFAAVVLVFVLLHVFKFPRASFRKMSLKITIPEDFCYENAFDDILNEYCTSFVMHKIKSSDMGTLFILSFDVTLKKGVSTKDMLDKIREKNGNLDISLTMKRFKEYIR